MNKMMLIPLIAGLPVLLVIGFSFWMTRRSLLKSRHVRVCPTCKGKGTVPQEVKP